MPTYKILQPSFQAHKLANHKKCRYYIYGVPRCHKGCVSLSKVDLVYWSCNYFIRSISLPIRNNSKFFAQMYVGYKEPIKNLLILFKSKSGHSNEV